jgi:hypothetical protein
MPGTPAATAVTHFHVCESDAGCLPETEPQVTCDAELALDALAHLLAEWASGQDGQDNECDDDAAYAAAAAETYCGCPPHGGSADHADALARLSQGEHICETAGRREFEIQVCRQRDCLKYCPAGGCRTVTSVTDLDAWCWCCGSAYVPWDSCPWLP